MFEIRCKQCNRLLAKEDIQSGSIEIKCPSCNSFTSVERITIDSRSKEAYDYDEQN